MLLWVHWTLGKQIYIYMSTIVVKFQTYTPSDSGVKSSSSAPDPLETHKTGIFLHVYNCG